MVSETKYHVMTTSVLKKMLCSGLNFMKLSGAYLGTLLSQVDQSRRINKRLAVLLD